MIDVVSPKLRKATDVFGNLSDAELDTVWTGGSVRCVALSPQLEQFDAWIDAYGLWLDDPMDGGYVFDVRGWKVAEDYRFGY